MSAKAELLFLAHRIPYPPDKGDKIRSWRLLEHLAARFRVHLAAFVDDPGDFAHEAFLARLCESVYLERLHPLRAKIKSAAGLIAGEPLSFRYFRSPAMRRRIAALRDRPLAAEVAFSSAMAAYLEAPRGSRPRLVDLCDADSEKWRSYARTRRGPMQRVYAREADVSAAAEARIVAWADAVFAVSPAEAALLNGAGKVRVLRNGVDAAYFSPAPDRPAPEGAADVVFVGAMDYTPNVDAALWFANEVWPRIRAAAPTARLAIIGPRPGPEICTLAARAGVAVTGRVDDVRPWLQQAGAVVAPLRLARGVPNKVLEAMAMARPVVATSAANAGIGAQRGAEILLADEAGVFAESVVSILTNSPLGDKIGAAARARIAADFAWPAQLAVLDAALSETGAL